MPTTSSVPTTSSGPTTSSTLTSSSSITTTTPAGSLSTVQGEYGCYTDFGQRSVANVETFSRVYSITTPVTYYNYVTPSKVTVTITPTGVTPTGQTSAATITSTLTLTTITSITAGTLATLPAPAGFTPLASALIHSAQNVGGDSSSAVVERSETQPLMLGLNANNAAIVADPPLFPQVVHCERVIRIFAYTTVESTVTGVFTTFVTAPTPSQTVPSVPAQVTTTTTTYTTSTVTAASMPTATLYAACQSDNLVSHVPGRRPIVQAANDYSVTRERRYANSAYACCVSCQLENGCTGSLYYRNACYTFRPSTDTCGNPGDLRWGRRANFDGAFVASNGKCGSWRLSQTPPTTEWEDDAFVRN
ncbi:hypothetical protein CKAH01_05411 [Colletotrichum kahawae]|uniref:Apple domain-containing protein n=1 Tax=Colletotrichum kahawae TaxID=34407 RepID=A0AAD9YEV8_COLKA|nr:hypothetical protein CKAH01_05411 [Colletotrichum kahawae]